MGQAASALTSLTASIKRPHADRDDDGGSRQGIEDHGEHGHVDEDEKKVDEGLDHYAHEGHEHHEHHQHQADDYRNEHATQAAIAAMESLAAQTSLHLQESGAKSLAGRNKRETGPEAERMRKDQHKEVERKRREQISNGITELQAIVPGCDAKGINKTAIINAAVRYIQELKNNEASNIEKWTLEKLLMDQAMNDLNQQLDIVRKENSRFRAQLGLPDPPEEEPQYADEGQHEGEHHEHGEDQQQDVGQEHGANGNLDPSLEEVDAKEGSHALNQVAEAAVAAAEAENTNDTAFDGDDDARNKRARAAQESDISRAKRGRVA